MDYLHYEFHLGVDDVVEVTLDGQANVQLLDEANYSNYRDGRAYHYIGGYAKSSPCRLKASRAGHWHLVVDLGGYAGTVRASARVLKAATA